MFPKSYPFCNVDVDLRELLCVCSANYPIWVSGYGKRSGTVRECVCGTTPKQRKDDMMRERFSEWDGWI
jgi:hypothetical protein